MITKKQFLQDVAHEARQIKALSTQKEKDNLNLATIDPSGEYGCIYGQMYNGCTSDRAKVIMDNSCVRVSNSKEFNDLTPIDLHIEKENTWQSIKSHINGEYKGQTWDGHGFSERDFDYLSMIEVYICMKDAKIKNLVDFIKGKREDLVL